MIKQTIVKSLIISAFALLLNACMPEPKPLPESVIKQLDDGTYSNNDELLKRCKEALEEMPDIYAISREHEYCREYDASVKSSQVAQQALDNMMAQFNDPDMPPEKDQLNAALLFAATAGDLKTLNKLLEMGADPNAENKLKMTALMTAANSIHPECVKALLDAGANPNAQDFNKFTALILASNNALNSQSVRWLIEKGADVNTKANNEVTALLVATQKNCTQCTYDLIKAGADVNVSESLSGYTPLLFAVAASNVPSIKFLIDSGADVNATAKGEGVTPLLMSAVNWDPTPALMLLNAGANPNVKLDRDGGMSFSDIRKDSDVFVVNEEAEAKLNKALFIGRAKRLFIF